ncbi:MAG: hypothetical protein KFW09_05770 [Oscillospiraceae bacterium]|nr:hypothetical protein [Oscillospiraceae bacterium]
MKINDFKEKKDLKKEAMHIELELQKLENVRSLWYFVTSSSRKAIVGSKGLII